MNKFLVEGDVIKLSEEHTIYAELPKRFIFSDLRRFATGHAQVWLKEPELDWLLGKYVVLHTLMGGEGMNHDGVYPHGHHVYCEKIEEPAQGIKIDFYQSGCFTAMIPEITPIGKAVRKWRNKMNDKCEWKNGTLEKCDYLNLVLNRNIPDTIMEFCPYCKEDIRNPKLQIIKSNDTWVTHDSGIDYLYFGEENNAEDISKYDIDRIIVSSNKFLHYSYERCWKSFTGDNPEITELTDEICKLRPIVIQLAFCPPYKEGTHRVAWGLCNNYVITTTHEHFNQLAIVKCNLRLATFHELQLVKEV